MTGHTRLKELAQAVQEGMRWYSQDDLFENSIDRPEDLAYIEAASPDVVLGLIAEIENLKAYAMHERSLGAEGPMIALNDMTQECDQLRARIAELEGQEPVATLVIGIEDAERGTAGFDLLNFKLPVGNYKLFIAPGAAPREFIPCENTQEANDAIETMLAEYNYPANTRNAGRAGYRAARLMMEKMTAPTAPKPLICEWTKDPDFEMGDTYDSSCGEKWSFIDGGPQENRVRFCQGCGKSVGITQKGSV